MLSRFFSLYISIISIRNIKRKFTVERINCSPMQQKVTVRLAKIKTTIALVLTSIVSGASIDINDAGNSKH